MLLAGAAPSVAQSAPQPPVTALAAEPTKLHGAPLPLAQAQARAEQAGRLDERALWLRFEATMLHERVSVLAEHRADTDPELRQLADWAWRLGRRARSLEARAQRLERQSATMFPWTERDALRMALSTSSAPSEKPVGETTQPQVAAVQPPDTERPERTEPATPAAMPAYSEVARGGSERRSMAQAEPDPAAAVKDFASRHWQWVATLLLIPTAGLGWAAHKRRATQRLRARREALKQSALR